MDHYGTTGGSYELQSIVQNELREDEELRWSGQPQVGRFVLKSLPILLFGIPFAGFAVFWICAASGFKIPDFSEGGFSLFPLFGIPFLLIGLGMLSAPFWAARKAKKTIYAVTNQRAIIFEGGRSVKVDSFGPPKLNDISKRVRADGSGDLVLERRVSYSHSRQHGSRERIKEIGFFGIEQVNHVEDLIAALSAGEMTADG